MVAEYLPLAFMAVFAVLFIAGSLVASALVSLRRPNAAKQAPFECGNPSEGVADIRIPVRYYVIALLFLVFDVETVFILFWATRLQELGVFGLIEMAVFLGILLGGLAYAWKKGALEWK